MNVVNRESSVRPATERRATRRRVWCRLFAAVAFLALLGAGWLALHAAVWPAMGCAAACLVFGAAAYMTDNDAAEEQP